MSRLFVGNFSFEQMLERSARLPKPVRRLESELSTVWVPVLKQGDGILITAEPEREFLDRMRELTNANVLLITESQLNSSHFTESHFTEIVPWGWTDQVRQFADGYGLKVAAPVQPIVTEVNTRRFAVELESTLGSSLFGAACIDSVSDFEAHLDTYETSVTNWVLKPQLSQAGRGQIRIRAPHSDAQVSRIRKLLRSGNSFIMEPCLDSVFELGVLWEIPQEGELELLAVSRLLSTERGAYLGTTFDLSAIPTNCLNRIRSSQRDAVRHIQELGYFGPLGIDAMIYRDQHGSLCTRPLQDINARWTMGRIAWEWQRRLAPRFSPKDQIVLAPTQQLPDGVSLSPEQIEGQPNEHPLWWKRMNDRANRGNGVEA